MGERKDLSTRCLQRAIERGVLPPDADISMILDSWAGLMLFRCLFFSQILDESDVELLVDATLAAPLRFPA
ncbi:TetR-like C-terminal domain-containing protein [Streptomyces thioluteus]|uniref:TetR-like C-terminal domain-containing protein n=1 Tax=Streptomyces thioluteus TaxID=66431 RepID=UPI003CD05AB4